jgi:hypothetical protein
LLIGVGTTAYTPWSLTVSVKDVRALRKLLVTPDLCGYPDDDSHVRVLTNAGATRDDILAGLAWLRERVADDPEATALVYYSGHGWLDNRTGKYYLIPYDATPQQWPGSFLPAESFAAALEDLRPKRLLAFLDCCHAAGMADKTLDKLLPDSGKSMAFPKGLADELAQGRGRAIFASSRGEEASQYRPDGRLSIYTEELLAALQGAGNRPRDTRVTVGNLMAHLGRAVPASAWRLREAVQTPVFKFEAEDFPVALLRGGKGLPAGGWAAVEDEARATIERIVAGPGAVVAREIHAPVATQGGIAAGGNITITGDGNVLGNNNRVDVQKGGIRARHIEAQNVVDGVMASPEALQHAGELVGLARAIERGGISADTIKARNVVSGLYVPSAETPEELRREVARLRAQVRVAVEAGEIEHEGDAEDALDALSTAEEELAEAEPRERRVGRKLKEAAEVLTEAAEAATAAGKVGRAVVKLAPVAMMLWKLAEAIL